MTGISADDIEALRGLLERSRWQTLKVRVGDIAYRLTKETQAEQVPVVAPHVGTFRCSGENGGAPFVTRSQFVLKSAQLCRIVVLDTAEFIFSELQGTVCHICVSDGDLVEYGQALFYIEPSS